MPPATGKKSPSLVVELQVVVIRVQLLELELGRPGRGRLRCKTENGMLMSKAFLMKTKELDKEKEAVPFCNEDES